MKKVALFIVLIFISASSFAGSSCYTNVFGDYICEYDDGSSSSTSTDVFGNDNTIFSDGSTMSCYTDVFGNYICD